jgi:IS30 family transposase
MSYIQITPEERYRLAALRKQGVSQAAMARELGRSPSTISREFARNTCSYDRHYRPSKAQERTNGRRSRSRRNHRFTVQDLERVNALLDFQWSPEQIAAALREAGLLTISHETIYRHIWRDKKAGGLLYQHLRGARKRRRKRYGKHDSRGRLASKRPIAERPPEVALRAEKGHWEIDTVMGSGSKDCVVTIVERKTGFLIIGKLADHSMESMNERVIPLIQKHSAEFKTVTADNGTEFHGYADIEKKTGTVFYFATPYHSWERGSNENANGLIRQYLPKGTSMAMLTQKQCNAIAHKINTRPRKRLGFKSPWQCFYDK